MNYFPPKSPFFRQGSSKRSPLFSKSFLTESMSLLLLSLSGTSADNIRFGIRLNSILNSIAQWCRPRTRIELLSCQFVGSNYSRNINMTVLQLLSPITSFRSRFYWFAAVIGFTSDIYRNWYVFSLYVRNVFRSDLWRCCVVFLNTFWLNCDLPSQLRSALIMNSVTFVV